MSESVHQYIRLRGAPRERGLQYGRAAAERIRAVIREYGILFEKEASSCCGRRRRRRPRLTRSRLPASGRI